jgi:SpoVK/Ycf46/Vps4 family AAA+-type ATPase
VEIRANVPAKPVLSDERRQTLEQIRSQVKSRWRVYDHWGLADTMNRGLGITSLFAGESGTGKTMAAEVIANDLDLDLFRVDLSMVVNKYIGETEKHLRRLFDAVESCGAILCFDECDALFGKRSEVKDSHDRYANIEISYLLQRLESYRGLCILTTNNRGALDSSFLRRFRFIVTFPMPTVAERKQIWQRQLGADGADSQRGRIPTSSLDYERLAQLPFSGGNIHSVIVNAAFRAAAREEAAHVTMRDILAAARDELVKLERPIDEAEFILAELAAPEAAA